MREGWLGGLMAARLFRPSGTGSDGLSWAGLAVSGVIPLAMELWPEAAGALRRVMFAVSFVWIWKGAGRP